ncbi:MAG: hypothetical protein GY757_59460, partial [bacterium]|nr:hypothetical protein [bacterium]
MKKTVFIIMVVLMGSLLFGEQIGVLPEVLMPEQMVVLGDNCYILEEATISIYSLKDLKLIKKFGKKGEGPGEMLKLPFLTNGLSIADNKILVDAINKVLFFTPDGVFLKEVKKKGQQSNVLSLKNGYVATSIMPPSADEKKNNGTVNLTDKELNSKKVLYKQELGQQGSDFQMVADSLNVAVYDGKIFIEKSSEGYIIDVLDSTGKQLYRISKKVTPLEFTEKDKARVIEHFKTDKLVSSQIKGAGGWDAYKKRLNFHYPKHFPPILDLLVKDGKIYVRTHVSKDGKDQYHILDLKGKELKTVYLPKAIQAPLITQLFNRVVRLF